MVQGKKVKGGPLDAYEEYVVTALGNRLGIPGTERHGNMLATIQDAITDQRVNRPVVDYDGDIDVATSVDAEMKRPRSDTTESEEKGRPPTKRQDITPAQSNLPADQQVSPNDNPLINPNSRVRNTRRQIDMDIKEDEPMPMALRSAGESASTSGTSKSTSGTSNRIIMPMYTTPKRSWFEKRQMVVLPVKINFSINKLDRVSPILFRFQLNDTYNQYRQYTEGTPGVTFPAFVSQQFPTNAQTGINQLRWETEAPDSNVATSAGATPTITGTFRDFGAGSIATSKYVRATQGTMNDVFNRAKGISRDMVYDQFVERNHGTLVRKPVNLNMYEARRFVRTTPCTGTAGGQGGTGSGTFGTADGDIAPDFRNFYEEMYQVRHVHGCNWRMTIENGSNSVESQAVCLHKTESITNGYASANENLTINSTLHDAVQWPRVQQKPIKGKFTTISGQWRSKDAHHEVVDADEIKNWYQCGQINGPAPAKTWDEFETMMFYADANAYHYPSFNVQFEAEWIVEYRDLKKVYRNITRENALTKTLGPTGTMQDLYTRFESPVDATSWPSVKSLALSDIKHVEGFLHAKESY